MSVLKYGEETEEGYTIGKSGAKNKKNRQRLLQLLEKNTAYKRNYTRQIQFDPAQSNLSK